MTYFQSVFSVVLLMNILPIPASFLVARRDENDDKSQSRPESFKSPRRTVTQDGLATSPRRATIEGKLSFNKSEETQKKFSRRRKELTPDASVGSSSLGSSSPRDEMKKGSGLFDCF